MTEYRKEEGAPRANGSPSENDQISNGHSENRAKPQETQGKPAKDGPEAIFKKRLSKGWGRDGYRNGEGGGLDEDEILVDEYTYRDVNGECRFSKQKIERWENGRRVSKRYPISRFLIHGGVNVSEVDHRNWAWGLGDVEPILYFLNDWGRYAPGSILLPFCEGEKDADTAINIFSHGTTTIHGGAFFDKNGVLQGWRESYKAPLTGHHILFFEHNDKAGRQHVQIVGRLLKGVAASMRVVRFRDKKEIGYDLARYCEERFGVTSDYLTKEQLEQLKAELMERAEDWVDEENPLDIDELIARTKEDPGAPFEPETVKRLALLKQNNPADYERLILGLKKLKDFRVSNLEKIIRRERPATRNEETQDGVLLALAQEAELFHTASSAAFADVRINDHRETWALKDKGFRNWLRYRYYQKTGSAPSSEAFQSAVNALEARAQFEAPERKVFVRSGGLDGKIYLDMCDDDWRAIEIDKDGWRVIDEPPVRFRRAPGMKPLPVPQTGGNVKALKKYLNASDDDFILAVAFMLMALKDDGPYIILVLMGEQGAAKSTFAHILRMLIDPNVAALRTISREDRDLAIAANNAHVQAFDNVSALPPWLADAICRLATGSGFATRELCTDTNEIIFDARRPIILNGIDGFITRPDLADRCLMLNLKEIPETERKLENELIKEFEQEAPQILGAVLDVMAHGLREFPRVRIDRFPRMADFYKWIKACDGALKDVGDFDKAYEANRLDMAQRNVESDVVAVAICELLNKTKGRALMNVSNADLLKSLEMEANSITRSKSSWPTSARGLSSRLTRIAPPLRKIGVIIEHVYDTHSKSNKLNIRKDDAA